MDDNNFGLRLNFYPENNEHKAIKYWSEVASMSSNSFSKNHKLMLGKTKKENILEDSNMEHYKLGSGPMATPIKALFCSNE